MSGPASLLLAAAVLLAAAPPAPTPAPGGSFAHAPYDSPPVAGGAITITLDLGAARAILAVLSREHLDPAEAKALESFPAVRTAIRDSNRPAEVFQHDLAAAFDEKSRVTVFDFRGIREARSRWEELLAVIASREGTLTKLAADRALALLPPDSTISVRVGILLTFGLPGRADHVVMLDAEGTGRAVVIDLARALTDFQASAPAEQVQHLSRLMAGEAFQPAWAAYRASKPAWQKHDPGFGQLEPLLRIGAEVGPAALYNVDENFFPLSVWLKEPMRASIDELNRIAEKLVSTQGDLDSRVALAAQVARPEFAATVAGPAGAFLADGIIQVLGLDAYRATLAGGPRAFYEAYDRATQRKKRELIPLAKVIRERLAAPAAPAH